MVVRLSPLWKVFHGFNLMGIYSRATVHLLLVLLQRAGVGEVGGGGAEH